MSAVALDKSALGRAIITKQTGCVTATNFTYQQDQKDTFMSVVTSGKVLGISLRVRATSLDAEKKYGYGSLTKDFQPFNVVFTTSYQVTAAALAALVQAAFPLLSVTESAGLITIHTNGHYGLVIDYQYYHFLTRTEISSAFDLTTYKGATILMGTTSDSNIRYSENPVAGVSPTSAVGILVVTDNPFDIVGRENIMKCQFIQSGGTALVDYTIYI